MKEYLSVFAFGGTVYCSIEILWRGRTHWTMAVLGGLCFLIIYLLNKKLKGKSLILRCVLGASIITALEFLVGYAVNIRLGWQVWDYSKLRFNLMGQICLRYFLLWFLLCIPVIAFAKLFDRRFGGRLKN